MDMIEAGIWSCEGADRCDCVSLYFSSLALQTGTSPVANIFVDARPDVSRSNQLLCCPDSRMRQRVENLKHSTAERWGNVGPWYTCGSITEQGNI